MQKPPSEDFFRYMQKQGHVPEGMDYTTFKGKMANPEVRKAYHAGLQKEKVYSGSLQQFEEQELADIVPKKKNTASGQQSKQPTSPSVPNTGQEGQTVESDQASGTDGQLPLAPLGVAGSGPSYNKVPDAETNPFGFKEYNTQDNLQPVARQQAQEYEGEIARSKKRSYDRVKQSGQQPYVAPDLDAANTLNYSSAEETYLQTQFARGDNRLPLGQLPAFDLKRAMAPYESELKDAAFVYEDVMANLKVKYGKDFFTQIEQNTAKRNELVTRFNQSKSRQEQEQIMATVQQIDNSMAKFKEDPLFADLTLAANTIQKNTQALKEIESDPRTALARELDAEAKKRKQAQDRFELDHPALKYANAFLNGVTGGTDKMLTGAMQLPLLAAGAIGVDVAADEAARMGAGLQQRAGMIRPTSTRQDLGGFYNYVEMDGNRYVIDKGKVVSAMDKNKQGLTITAQQSKKVEEAIINGEADIQEDFDLGAGMLSSFQVVGEIIPQVLGTKGLNSLLSAGGKLGATAGLATTANNYAKTSSVMVNMALTANDLYQDGINIYGDTEEGRRKAAQFSLLTSGAVSVATAQIGIEDKLASGTDAIRSIFRSNPTLAASLRTMTTADAVKTVMQIYATNIASEVLEESVIEPGVEYAARAMMDANPEFDIQEAKNAAVAAGMSAILLGSVSARSDYNAQNRERALESFALIGQQSSRAISTIGDLQRAGRLRGAGEAEGETPERQRRNAAAYVNTARQAQMVINDNNLEGDAADRVLELAYQAAELQLESGSTALNATVNAKIKQLNDEIAAVVLDSQKQKVEPEKAKVLVNPETQAKVLAINEEMIKANIAVQEAVNTIVDLDTGGLDGEIKIKAAQRVEQDLLGRIEALIAYTEARIQELEDAGETFAHEMQELKKYNEAKVNLIAAQEAVATNQAQLNALEAEAMPQGVYQGEVAPLKIIEDEATKQNVSQEAQAVPEIGLGEVAPLKIIEDEATKQNVSQEAQAVPASTSDATSWTVESDDKQTVITFGKARPTAKDLSVLNAIGAKVDMDNGTITVKPNLRKQVNRMFPDLGIIAPASVAVSNEAPVAESTQDSDTVKQREVDIRKAEIEKEREVALDKSSVDARIKPGAGTGVKVGQKVNDGNRVIVLSSIADDSYNPEMHGDGYAVYSRIISDAEFVDDKMSKAAEVEVTIFSDKETAEKTLQEKYEKLKAKELAGEGKKRQAINQEYDAKIKELEQPTEEKNEKKPTPTPEPKVQQPVILPDFKKREPEAKKPILNAKGEQMLGNPEAYAANRIEGFDVSFTSADGKVYKGKYVLTTAQALTPSHNENNTAEANPNFPVGPDGKPMNSREYLPGTTEALEVQVRAVDFDGKALASIPVVAPNTGVVISGNGRTMSRRLAAKSGKDTKYMAVLRANAHLYGITQEQIDAMPGAFLVIEINEEPEYTVALFHEFNKQTEIGESPLVRAARISRTLIKDNAKLSALAKLLDGFKTPGEASNDAKFPAQFVSFMKRNGFMNEADAAKYVNPSGLLTEEGKILVESVALAAAYPSDLIRMLDMEGMGLIKLRLMSGILPLIQNRMLGDKKSLQPHMMGAIRLAYQAKKAGLKVHEMVGTMSLMDDADVFSIEEAGLALMFETNNSQVEKAEFRALVNSINSRVSTASLMGEAETVSDVLTEYAEAGLRMTKKEYNARNEMKAKTTVRPELLAMEKAGGVKDLVRIFMQQYNMSSGRAVAAAFVVHDMAKEMAKRSGKTIDEVYQSISWTKQEPGKGDNALFQLAENEYPEIDNLFNKIGEDVQSISIKDEKVFITSTARVFKVTTDDGYDQDFGSLSEAQRAAERLKTQAELDEDTSFNVSIVSIIKTIESRFDSIDDAMDDVDFREVLDSEYDYDTEQYIDFDSNIIDKYDKLNNEINKILLSKVSGFIDEKYQVIDIVGENSDGEVVTKKVKLRIANHAGTSENDTELMPTVSIVKASNSQSANANQQFPLDYEIIANSFPYENLKIKNDFEKELDQLIEEATGLTNVSIKRAEKQVFFTKDESEGRSVKYGNNSKPLFQENKQTGLPRAAITIKDGAIIIHSLYDPNVSSPIHEMAHAFEAFLTPEEKATVLEWAKHKEWTASTSEVFARGFERFLHEGGKTDEQGNSVNKIFKALAGFLKQVYKSLRESSLYKPLTPKVRTMYANIAAMDSDFAKELEGLGLSEENLKAAKFELGLTLTDEDQELVDIANDMTKGVEEIEVKGTTAANVQEPIIPLKANRDGVLEKGKAFIEAYGRKIDKLRTDFKSLLTSVYTELTESKIDTLMSIIDEHATIAIQNGVVQGIAEYYELLPKVISVDNAINMFGNDKPGTVPNTIEKGGMKVGVRGLIGLGLGANLHKEKLDAGMSGWNGVDAYEGANFIYDPLQGTWKLKGGIAVVPIQKMESIKPNTTKTLGELIDSPVLFAAYPELAGIKVNVATSVDKTGTINASFDIQNMSIDLKTSDEQNMIDSLMHETQHAIQMLENNDNVKLNENKLILDAFAVIPLDERNALLAEIVRNDNTRDAVGNVLSKITNYPLNSAPRTDASPELKAACVNLFTDYIYALENEVVRSKGQFEVDPTRSINSFAYQAHAAEFEAFNVESEENARFKEKQYPQRVAMNADIKLIHKELSKSGSSRVAMGQVRFGTGLFGHVDKFADMVVASNNADATTMEAASAALLQDLLAAAEAKNEQAQRTNGYLASNEIAKSAAKIGVDNTQNETQANRLSFFTMLQSTGDAMKSAFRGGVRNLILTRQLLLNGNASWPTHALRNGNGIDRLAHKALLKATSASIADTPKDKYPEQALALLYQQVFGYSKGMDEGEAAAKFVQAINKGFEGDISTMDKTEMTKKLHQAMLEQSANILYSQNPIMMRLLATTLRNASPNSTGVLNEEAALNDPRIVAEQLEYLVSADDYLKDYKDGVFQMRGKKKTKLTKALSAARSLLGALKYKSIEDSGTWENQVGDDFKQSYYDKFNALHKAVEKDKDLRTMKGKEQLADEDNASDLIKLQQGRIAAKNDKLVDWFNGQSSAKIVQGAATANSWVGRMTKLTKSTFDEVSLYMHARHAVSRNARVAEMAVNRREAEVARLTVQIDRVEDLIAAELDSSAIVDRYKDRIAALEQSIADGLSPAKQYRAEQKIEKLQGMIEDRIAGKMNSKRIEALQNKLTEIQKQIEFVESAVDYDSEIKELAQQRDDLAKEALAAKAQNNQVKFDRIMQDYMDVSYRLKEIAEENPYVNSFAGSGMLTSTANGIVAEFEGRATKEAVEELANEFYDNTTRAKIEQLFENGFINLERYEALKSGMKGGILTFDPETGMTMDDSNALDTLLENYLPLSVKQEYYEGADDYISGSDLGSAAVSDLVGTDSYGIMERDNPVINAVAQMNSTNRAVETNKTKKAMVGMMSGGNFYKWRIYKFGPMKLTLQKGGDFASGNEEKDLSRHVVEENSISYQDEGNTYYLFIPPVEGENGVRSVNPIVTIFKNKDSKNAAGIEYIFRIFRAMGTYLRLTATSLNMSFTLWNNPIRDIFEANANLSSLPRKDLLKIRGKTLANLPFAFATLTRNKFNTTNTSKLDKYWADAIEDGVEMSWNADGSRVDYAQKLEAFTERFSAGARSKTVGDRFDTALDAFTTISDITENMTRLAVYAAVRDAGMSRQQAAIVAKEITVNFEQKGESIGKLNAMYTFLNAQIIGTFRGTAALATKAGLRFYVYCTLFGIANAMLKHGLSGDDDDEYLYDTVMMERKVLIPNPVDTKNPIRLPRPMSVFGAGEMMGELVYEALINRKMNIYEAVSIAFNKHLQSINPISRDHVMFQTFAPTPFQPIAAAAENRTYANKPIIYGEEFMTGVGGLPVWQQYNKDPGKPKLFELLGIDAGYSDASKFLSSAGLDFQPDDLKYTMNQYIGTAPKHGLTIVMAAYKAAAEAAGVEVKYPYPDKREYPLIGQMYQNTDSELQGKAYLAVGMLANQAENFDMNEEKYKFVEKMLTNPDISGNLNKKVAKVAMKRLATVRAIMDEQMQPNPDQEAIKLLKQDLYAKFKKEESEEE